jgi:hypothetical protein
MPASCTLHDSLLGESPLAIPGTATKTKPRFAQEGVYESGCSVGRRTTEYNYRPHSSSAEDQFNSIISLEFRLALTMWSGWILRPRSAVPVVIPVSPPEPRQSPTPDPAILSANQLKKGGALLYFDGESPQSQPSGRNHPPHFRTRRIGPACHGKVISRLSIVMLSGTRSVELTAIGSAHQGNSAKPILPANSTEFDSDRANVGAKPPVEE